MPENDQRDKREFVPPPWERDQFDELARRKVEQDLDRLVENIGAPAAAPAAGTTGAETVTEADQAEQGVAPTKASPASGGLKVSDAELQVMLYGLKAEEPDTVRHASLAALVVAVLMSVGGALILGYGLYALSRSMKAGAGAAVGAATVIGVGGLFIAAGAWLAVKGLRQRGEL